MNKRSVQPYWCSTLPIQQQSVLFLAARGPDGVGKDHPCKEIQRAYRACVLVAAKYGRLLKLGERADSFMSLEIFGNKDLWPVVVAAYFRTADSLPHHYRCHLMHGVEILGYKHPTTDIRLQWRYLYLDMVKDLHLNPETEEEMDDRLGDWGQKDWDPTD